MNNTVYRFDIKAEMAEFYKDIISVKNHNYKIDQIVGMIISTYKNESVNEIQNIARYCMEIMADDDKACTDMHILLNAILRLRLDLFRLLNDFELVHMRNENNQFPYQLHLKSLTNEYLLIEARIN